MAEKIGAGSAGGIMGLSIDIRTGTSPKMISEPGPSQIFDPKRRVAARDRAHARFADHDFLYRHMIDGLLERLGDVLRPLNEVLLIGCPDTSARDALIGLGKTVTCCDPGSRNATVVGGVQAEEDALPFSENSFDLIVACDTLDTVNDLPGALIGMRRVLRSDGLFLGACVGAPSLSKLKKILLQAEGDHAAPHVHPQIDVRSVGDLLTRAGFAMPVVDIDTLTVRYASLLRLMHDLRGMGHGNRMARERSGPLTRESVTTAALLFEQAADPDGKTAETFSILYMSGWKPDPSQPRPARRGSAKVPLAKALKPKG